MNEQEQARAAAQAAEAARQQAEAQLRRHGAAVSGLGSAR